MEYFCPFPANIVLESPGIFCHIFKAEKSLKRARVVIVKSILLECLCRM